MKRYYFYLTLPLFTLVALGCSLRPENQKVEGVNAAALSQGEWMALSKPGPSHRLLEVLVGTWDAKLSFRSEPGGKVQVSPGTSTISWILGERFIKEEFTGEALGERFQGLGITGYDSAARRFTNVWIDSLNTALATSFGKYLPEENRFDFIGEVYDPLRGGMKTTRSMMRVISTTKYEFVMFDTTPTGTEYAALQIEYTKR